MVISNPFLLVLWDFINLKKPAEERIMTPLCMTYAKYNLEVLFTYFLKSVIIERNTVSFHALIQKKCRELYKIKEIGILDIGRGKVYGFRK